MSSVFGDLMSFMSSCASSSICVGQPLHSWESSCLAHVPTSVWSVALVPLLSTGEGSTVAGYGLGGGSRWSAPDDLGGPISTQFTCLYAMHDWPHLFEKTWLKLAGELGESV